MGDTILHADCPRSRLSLLASIVVFVSRTFSETGVAAQGTPSGYEIREK